MRELLEFIIKSIAKNPDKVEVTEEKSEEMTQFFLKLEKEDIGGIIGRQGKTIKAIKTVLSILAQGKRFSIEVLEN